MYLHAQSLLKTTPKQASSWPKIGTDNSPYLRCRKRCSLGLFPFCPNSLGKIANTDIRVLVPKTRIGFQKKEKKQPPCSCTCMTCVRDSRHMKREQQSAGSFLSYGDQKDSFACCQRTSLHFREGNDDRSETGGPRQNLRTRDFKEFSLCFDVYVCWAFFFSFFWTNVVFFLKENCSAWTQNCVCWQCFRQHKRLFLNIG